jgi:1-acyl-sn-glycerol-3-phosphate acyltransferase
MLGVMPESTQNEPNQFRLLGQRRFLPLFATQLLGALNDNLLKIALVMLVTYGWAAEAGYDAAFLVPLCNGIIIMPFFLFSATAGQVADKYDKAWLIRRVKLLEIAAMLLAAVGLAIGHLEMMIGVLFLMGLQSTFFGPLKYSILPGVLTESELVGGNALIETGTFLAVLVGTIAGGLLLQLESSATTAVSVVLVAVAIAGWLVSRTIPDAAPGDPNLQVRLNPFTETLRLIRFAKRDEVTFLSIMGNSWFWFYGATILTILPTWAATELNAGKSVVTLFLAVFCVGIGAGSLFCEKLARHRIELGLVPLGSIGMTLFAADLCFATDGAAHHAAGEAVDWLVFASSFGGVRVLVDLFAVSAFGGMYIVPLFAIIQERAPVAHRSRIIAANNIINAAWMVASAALTMALGLSGVSAAMTFLVLAVLNAVVALYIYNVLPLFMLRFIVWSLIHTLYRLDATGTDKLPDDGPVVIVANHVTFVDGLIVSAVMKRHVRFVMDHNYADLPIIRYLVDKGGIIPIAPKRESETVLEQAFETIAEAITAGEVVCIFPEGKLTGDGEMDDFRTGIERILERTPAPVLPMAFHGLWGSVFSRDRGKKMGVLPKRFWSKIGLVTGELVPAEQASASHLEAIVRELRAGKA